MRRVHLSLAAIAACLLTAVVATQPVAAANSPIIIRHVSTTKKVIALTFDDGYSPTRALEIAQILNRYGAQATFFPYSNATVGATSTWKQIAQQFPIGDHTTTHPNLTKKTPDQIYWEIDNARTVIEQETGVPMIPVFRPPGMFYNDTVLQEAAAAGFKYMALWSIDTQDALGADAQTVYQRGIQGQPGGIVLMHAGPAATVVALPRILDYYSSHGFTFVNIPQLFGFEWSPNMPLTPDPGTGPVSGPVCDVRCPDDAQLLWTGPVYVRNSPIFRAVPE